MFAPGVPEMMREFKSTNQELGSFVVSIYVLGYAFGPLIVAPLSELYGRLPVYHVCNILFVVFTIACALATNLNMLIGFRFIEGLFGSCPLTIGGGTIADMIPQQKRGGVMAIWALGPLMGPVIGPVAGGYLSQAKGWRWVFWIIAMAVSICFNCRGKFYTDRLGRSYLNLCLLLPPGNICTNPIRAQGHETTKSHRQHISQVEAEVPTHTSGTLQALHRPTHKDVDILPNRAGAVYVYGGRLWLSVPAIYHNHRGIRE